MLDKENGERKISRLTRKHPKDYPAILIATVVNQNRSSFEVAHSFELEGA